MIFDILLTYQAVVPAKILTNELNIQLVTSIGETNLSVEFETVIDPRPEILLSARLQFAKTRLFNLIQELQKVDRNGRQALYAQIKQIDESMEQSQKDIMRIRDKDIKSRSMDTFISFK